MYQQSAYVRSTYSVYGSQLNIKRREEDDDYDEEDEDKDGECVCVRRNI